jgi:hypothetical protein
MHMQMEYRVLLGKIFGTIIVIATGAVFGSLVLGNRNLLNINILLSVIGGLMILSGTVMFMIWPKSYYPVCLLLLGIGEQAAMLLVYLDIKLLWEGVMIAGLVVVILFCFAGIRHLDLHLSDEELDEQGHEPHVISPYEIPDSRYCVQEGRASNLKQNGEVVDINTARKPPMSG